jgi:hypothetical protein
VSSIASIARPLTAPRTRSVLLSQLANGGIRPPDRRRSKRTLKRALAEECPPACWSASTPFSHLIRGTQIPIAHAAPTTSPPAASSLGGLGTSALVCAAPPSWGRHPQTFTKADITPITRSFIKVANQSYV